MTRAASMNHVGAVVPDLEAAIAWYQDVMGFWQIGDTLDLKTADDESGQLIDVLGGTLKRIKVAHMGTGNGVGLELFEPVDPPHEPPRDTVEYWRAGFFHICITDPDVEGLAKRIAETGGKQLSKIWPVRPPETRYVMCYCADPFGNVLELNTNMYETMVAHQ